MLSVEDVNDISKERYYLSGIDSSIFNKIPFNRPKEMSGVCTTHLSTQQCMEYKSTARACKEQVLFMQTTHCFGFGTESICGVNEGWWKSNLIHS